MVGYSGTPLVNKLGIKANYKVYLDNPPENYLSLLGALPEKVTFLASLRGKADVIHIFARNSEEMENALFKFKDKIRQNGSIWVSWYKKSAKIPTDITEDVIRHAALPLGLVDIKVCAVDEVWSALKLVIRRENRTK
jgi:hypothetical protein